MRSIGSLFFIYHIFVLSFLLFVYDYSIAIW